MSEPEIPKPNSTQKPSPPKIPSGGGGGGGGGEYSHSHRPHFPNPPESFNPDAATLRDQWRFAIKQYSRWYSHAWGTAILAGLSFFALGWAIKGSNPLPSFDSNRNKNGDAASNSSAGSGADEHKPAAVAVQPPP